MDSDSNINDGEEYIKDIEDISDVRLASPLLAPSSSAAVEETFGFGNESPKAKKERMRSLSIIYFLGSVFSPPAPRTVAFARCILSKSCVALCCWQILVWNAVQRGDSRDLAHAAIPGWKQGLSRACDGGILCRNGDKQSTHGHMGPISTGQDTPSPRHYHHSCWQCDVLFHRVLQVWCRADKEN